MKKIKSLGLAIGYLIIGAVMMLAGSIGIAFLGGMYMTVKGIPADKMESFFTAWMNGEGSLVVTLFIYIGFAIVFGLLYYFFVYRKKKGTVRIKEGLCLKNTVTICVMAVAGQGVSLLIITIINLVSPKSIENYVQLTSNMDFSKTNPALIILSACIMAPIAEELLFRGMVYTSLRKGFSIVWATIFTAVIFSAYHMNIVQFIYIIPFGIASCLIYERTQTIFSVMLFHLVYNSSTFVLQAAGSLMEGVSGLIFTVLCVPVFIICIIKVITKELTGNENI